MGSFLHRLRPDLPLQCFYAWMFVMRVANRGHECVFNGPMSYVGVLKGLMVLS